MTEPKKTKKADASKTKAPAAKTAKKTTAKKAVETKADAVCEEKPKKKCCKKSVKSTQTTPPVAKPAPTVEKSSFIPASAASKQARSHEVFELNEEEAAALAVARAELAAIPEWPAFVAMQRQHLMDLRDRTLDSMAGVARDTLRTHPEGSEASGSGEHQADAGSDAYDREFALSILAKEQDGLYEIEQALGRIDNGTYGICEMSYKVIPMLRLEAIPFARLTVECQSKWEKEKGLSVRFRNRSGVGFAGIQNDIDYSVSLDEDEE